MSKSLRLFSCATFIISLFLGINATAIGQGNNIEWEINGGPYTTWTSISGSWYHNSSTTGGGTGYKTYSGSATPGSGNASATATVETSLSNSGSGASRNGAEISTDLAARVYGGKTLKLSIDFDGSADVTNAGTGNAGAAAEFTTGFSAYSWTNAQASVTGAGTDNQTGSGSGTVTSHGLCSSNPTLSRQVTVGKVFSESLYGYHFSGTSQSIATGTYSVWIPTDSPVIQFSASIAGNPITGTVDAGSNVRVDANAFDPDDQVGSSPPKNICNYAWEITDPDNITSTSSGTNLTYKTQTLTKAGPYKFKLTVTDNEGDTTTSTYTIVAGGKRECKPNNKKINEVCDEKTSLKIDPFCGDVGLVSHDPTATRGHPLQNEIQINSQPIGLPYTKWMGNSTFTYGLQIAFVTYGGGGGYAQPNRIIVDGQGRQFDYGSSLSGPNPKTPGVYPTLTEHINGFTLNDAGAPDEVYKTGNFTYEFDTTGRLLTITDPNGNTQEITYVSGDPTLVTDTSSGRTITLDYGTNGKINKVTENGGFAYREISYDTFDRVTAIVTKNASNVTIRSVAVTYDGNDRIATIERDGDSATLATLSYQDAGEGVSVANITYPTKSTSINYFTAVANGAKFRTNITNDKGGVVSYDYDANGNLIAIREPKYNGATAVTVHNYTYDANRNVLTENINGSYGVTYTYNSLGLVTRREDVLGRYTYYTYSGANLTKIENNIGTVAEFLYAISGLPNAISGFKDGAGNQWDIARNAYGQVTSITPPSGSPTGAMTFDYEENVANPDFGYLKTITNGAGDVATVNAYTSLGDPTSITTNPASGVTRTVQMTYDAVQRETVYTHADGKTIDTDYTGANATSVTDEAGTLTQYTYCADCGKLTGVSGPLSWALSWVLDDDKDVTSFTDAMSKTTTYTYGSVRELKQITYPDSTTLKYYYSNAGKFQKLMNGRNALAVNITHDAVGNIIDDGFFDYTYDNANRVLTAYDANSTVSYTYATNGLMASEAYTLAGLANSQVVEYTYNDDQTVDTITWKNGGSTVASWVYSYDGAGRVTSITNGFSETTNFTYDGEGKLLTQTNQNGTSRNYTYNNQRGWPTQIQYKLSSTVTGQYDLVYDTGANTVGNITGVAELSGATVNYTYDDLYRLTGETRSASPSYSRTYGYDLNGNPTTINGSSFATFDNANKVSTVLSKNVTHDNDGNLTAVAATSPISINAATWNNKNKMTRGTRTAGGYTDYRYMYDGKRYYSKASTGMTSVVYYIFAGDTLIGEITTSTPTAAYTWGPDGLISRRNLSTPASFWYEFGPQGETRTLTNSSGAATDTYNYNGYGEVIASSGSTSNPYKYKGKYGYYTESFTGLILATQRWYSPQLMRWISRDPIGYEGGVNLYEYVTSRPIFWSDPEGTNPAVAVGTVTGGGLLGAAVYCAVYPDACAGLFWNNGPKPPGYSRPIDNGQCSVEHDKWPGENCPAAKDFSAMSAARMNLCTTAKNKIACMADWGKWVLKCKLVLKGLY